MALPHVKAIKPEYAGRLADTTSHTILRYLERTLAFNILHLSDIHFKYQLDGTVHDLDHDVRNELEIDVRHVLEQTGTINAIVVTGDIAFAGKAEDYEVARTWLVKLCKAIGCETENVWVVPGNHDVDRDSVTKLVRTVQNSIQEATVDKIDRRIRQYVHEDSKGAEVLASSLSQYYKFSSLYGCKPKSGNLTWEYDLTLNLGYTLRLVGLNSALVSNRDDHQRNRPLIVGQAQLHLPRTKGCLYASLCHHPVTWLKDGPNVHNKLCKRVSLQLFGHVHEQALRQVGNSLIVQAGALHPDREHAGPWCPAYNVLTLEVIENDAGHCLSITAYPRAWSENHCFSADVLLGERQCQEHILTLDDAISIFATDYDEFPNGPYAAASAEPDDSDARTEQEQDMVNPVRQLAYAFLTLPFSTQVRIADQLSLLEDEDAGLDCAALFERVYQRAHDHGQLANLWEQVRTVQVDVAMMANPYEISAQQEEKHDG